jgi:hypothetical protein
MNTIEPAIPKKKSKLRRVAFVLIFLAGGAALAGWGWYRYTFPYGWSHACSKALGMTLHLYAEDHYGWLPNGQSTPEASLGLLAKHDVTTAYFLGGKNVPSAVVLTALTNNGTLSPGTCGWHYVEGLRMDDDPQIMVAWDKVVGLWHNGDRRRGLMHEVVFLDDSMSFIAKTNWPAFVAEQKQMLAKVIASRESNSPPIRWSDEATLGPNRQPPAPQRR